MGEAFVANMTGNTVLIGISLFRLHRTLHPAMALAGYVAGVALASYVTGRHQPRMLQGEGCQPKKILWTRSVSLLLLFECLCLGAIEVGWFAKCHDAAIPVIPLQACLGLCMGMQSGAMLQLQVPGVVTTYITGTWTQMVRGVARLVTGERITEPVGKPEFEERLLTQAGTLAAYFLSALVAGWFYRYARPLTGAVPVICLAIVAIYSLLRAGAYSVAD